MEEHKSPNINSNNKREVEGYNRRNALKRILGASGLLFGLPFTTSAAGEAAHKSNIITHTISNSTNTRRSFSNAAPTTAPTFSTTAPTSAPTHATSAPTCDFIPTQAPSMAPTNSPTTTPSATNAPTSSPTTTPSSAPGTPSSPIAAPTS